MMNDKLTILYVDDELLNLQLFAINFKTKYNVVTAESGQQGIDILKSNPEIKFVISDMKMPGMNGVQFIKLAKKEFSSILFYILTGYEITEEIADALNDKLILKYFRKPFNMKDIAAAIEEVI
jgi:response regulator RpfG family c-di-GMP phosphodiesterase